jgi:hypothetical protein
VAQDIGRAADNSSIDLRVGVGMSASRAKGSGLEWFVRQGSGVRGPFSSARVRHLVLEGRLQLEDEVSTDGTAWHSLGSVDEVVPLQMRSDDSELALQQDVLRVGNRRRASRAIVVTSSLLVILVLAVSLAGRQGPQEERDCAAPPVPGVMLEGCQLSGARMTAAALAGARLANASLAGAQLAESDLRDADLRYVDLSRADLSYAKLSGANLKGANLRLADLTNADLSGADLSFADLGGARTGGALFDRASLAGAIWTEGKRCASAECPR